MLSARAAPLSSCAARLLVRREICSASTRVARGGPLACCSRAARRASVRTPRITASSLEAGCGSAGHDSAQESSRCCVLRGGRAGVERRLPVRVAQAHLTCPPSHLMPPFLLCLSFKNELSHRSVQRTIFLFFNCVSTFMIFNDNFLFFYFFKMFF